MFVGVPPYILYFMPGEHEEATTPTVLTSTISLIAGLPDPSRSTISILGGIPDPSRTYLTGR